MKKSILVLMEDLLFSVQLQDTAKKLGYAVVVVQQEGDFSQQLENAPDLVLVDTTVKHVDWTKLVRAAKSRQRKVLAFGNHGDLEARERALAAGADTVLANAAVATNMSRLLEKHTQG